MMNEMRCCEDEDCMRCPVAYQPSSLCRGDVESHAADMLENHETARLALVKVLTMTPDIWRMLFFVALGVILRLIWERRC